MFSRFYRGFLLICFLLQVSGVFCACSHTKRSFSNIDDSVVDIFDIIDEESSDEMEIDSFNMPSLQKHIERFNIDGQVEETVTTADKFDLIFVVDKSGSMRAEQGRLVLSMKTFIDDFAQKNFDYKVTLIDELNNDPSFSIFTPSTPNLEQSFMESITTRTPSVTEEGMHSLITFLRGNGATFLRPDAFLKVIVMSDEADQSPIQQGSANIAYNRFSTNKYVSYFKNEIKQIKGDENFSISAIVHVGRPCEDDHRQIDCDKYGAIAQATSGKVYDIQAENFAPHISSMSQIIKRHLEKGADSSLSLQRMAKENALLKVYIDGVEKSKDVDWFYDSEKGHVSLSAYYQYDYIEQNEKAEVHVAYSEKHFFPLSREPDGETIKVFVEGEEKLKDTDWSYIQKGNKITFHPDASLEPGGLIEIRYYKDIQTKKKFNFQLSQIPNLSTIRILVDGELKVLDKDWFYDKGTNRIFFPPDLAPETGDRVEIEYKHAEFST